MRRLPVYFVLDVSESMVGEPLQQLEAGVERVVQSLRQDPHALETVYLSVIAFAGKAEIVAPLVDLVSFYPPRLPLGGGTAMGAALEVLMRDIDNNVARTTYEQRGDWEPVCFLVTDGKPTDNPDPAVKRWRESFASRAQLIAVTLGQGADFHTLQQLTPHVLALEDSSGEQFRAFIEWVTASVRTQSQGVEQTGTQIDLAKAEKDGLTVMDPADHVLLADPDYVVLTGRCSKSTKPYLMKYRKIPVSAAMREFVKHDAFGLEGCFALDENYFSWCTPGFEAATSEEVNTSVLEGVPPCPHCGNSTAFALCRCGHLLCTDGPGILDCPWCKEKVGFSDGGSGDFNVARGQG